MRPRGLVRRGKGPLRGEQESVEGCLRMALDADAGCRVHARWSRWVGRGAKLDGTSVICTESRVDELQSPAMLTALLLALIVIPALIPQDWVQSGPPRVTRLKTAVTSPFLALAVFGAKCGWDIFVGSVGETPSILAFDLVLYFYLAYVIVWHTGKALLITAGILGIGVLGFLLSLGGINRMDAPAGASLTGLLLVGEYGQNLIKTAQTTRDELWTQSPLPGYSPEGHALDVKHVARVDSATYRAVTARYGDGNRCLFQFRFTEAGRVVSADSETASTCEGRWDGVWSFEGSAGEFVAFGTPRYERSDKLGNSVARLVGAPARALRSVVEKGHEPVREIRGYGYVTRYYGPDEGAQDAVDARPEGTRVVRYDGTVADRVSRSLVRALDEHRLDPEDVRAARLLPNGRLRLAVSRGNSRQLLFVSIPRADGPTTTQVVDLDKQREAFGYWVYFMQFDVQAVMLSDGSLIARAHVSPDDDRDPDREPLDLIRVTPEGTIDAAFHRRASRPLQGHTVHDLWQVSEERIVIATGAEEDYGGTDGLLAITPSGRIDCGFRSPVPSLHVSVGCQADSTAGAEASVSSRPPRIGATAGEASGGIDPSARPRSTSW